MVQKSITMAKRNIINKGVHCKIRVHGEGLTEGKSYTACLYYSATHKGNFRAEVTATARVSDSVLECIFDFTPDKTAALKAGNVILEIYDTTTLQQMLYDEAFAVVRSTSLSR